MALKIHEKVPKNEGEKSLLLMCVFLTMYVGQRQYAFLFNYPFDIIEIL